MRATRLSVLAPLYILLSAIGSAAPGDPPEERTFELEDGKATRFGQLSLSRKRTERIPAAEERPEGLRGVPVLVAEKPLFGAVPLGIGTEARQLYFALDKRKASSRRYDRVYLDLDLDGDLSDEEQRRTWKPFELSLDAGDGLGERSIELKPRVHTKRNGPTTLALYFTKVRHGRIEIGEREFEVVLGQGPTLDGRYDRPDCPMVLDPRPSRYTESRLGSGRFIDGAYWVFSATPDGSRLTVKPYEGVRGTLSVGAGGRDVEKMSLAGYLLGDFDAPVGAFDEDDKLGLAEKCEIPVGSYRPSTLTVRYDTLSLDLSTDYYSQMESVKTGASPIEAIEIREGRPYVLDFAATPEIRFLEPEEEARFARGDEIQFEALLTYPKLGVMVRDIERWREGKRDGTWIRKSSLDPQVTVVDSKGKIRAKGRMPFG